MRRCHLLTPRARPGVGVHTHKARERFTHTKLHPTPQSTEISVFHSSHLSHCNCQCHIRLYILERLTQNAHWAHVTVSNTKPHKRTTGRFVVVVHLLRRYLTCPASCAKRTRADTQQVKPYRRQRELQPLDTMNPELCLQRTASSDSIHGPVPTPCAGIVQNGRSALTRASTVQRQTPDLALAQPAVAKEAAQPRHGRPYGRTRKLGGPRFIYRSTQVPQVAARCTQPWAPFEWPSGPYAWHSPGTPYTP